MPPPRVKRSLDLGSFTGTGNGTARATGVATSGTINAQLSTSGEL
jgi:hypothetical protein